LHNNAVCWQSNETFGNPKIDLSKIINISSFKVSSSSNQLEQLKCVFCNHLAPIASCKKGIISYKMTNGIFVLRKHIESKYGMSGLNKRKIGLKERNNLPKTV